MKRLFAIPLILFTLSLSSGQPEIPPSIKKQAIIKTDRQIDSVYKHSPISPVVDALRYDFRELRSHLDSINAENIIFQLRLHKELTRNDSITHMMLRMSLQNDSLRTIVKTQKEDIDFMKAIPNYLMMFVMIVFGGLLSLGMYHGWKERNEINNCENED